MVDLQTEGVKTVGAGEVISSQYVYIVVYCVVKKFLVAGKGIDFGFLKQFGNFVSHKAVDGLVGQLKFLLGLLIVKHSAKVVHSDQLSVFNESDV